MRPALPPVPRQPRHPAKPGEEPETDCQHACLPICLSSCQSACLSPSPAQPLSSTTFLLSLLSPSLLSSPLHSSHLLSVLLLSLPFSLCALISLLAFFWLSVRLNPEASFLLISSCASGAQLKMCCRGRTGRMLSSDS